MALPHNLIIEFDTIDSTNNYAMQLIDANKAQHGTVVTAGSQWAGKGQRGRTWVAAPGESLLMSVVVVPARPIQQQFVFNASIAVAIAKYLQNMLAAANVRIKWPNDLIVNDKKAGGILIENVIRGSNWSFAVIGLGLNVNQDAFPQELPHATSLQRAAGCSFQVPELRDGIWSSIMEALSAPFSPEAVMEAYNAFLFRKDELQGFSKDGSTWFARVLQANADGTLSVQESDAVRQYMHGQSTWDW